MMIWACWMTLMSLSCLEVMMKTFSVMKVYKKYLVQTYTISKPTTKLRMILMTRMMLSQYLPPPSLPSLQLWPLLSQLHILLHIFVDNYFTSAAVFRELLTDNIYACGTARRTRSGFPGDLKEKQPQLKERHVKKCVYMYMLVCVK